ncbi:MAG: tetratricopeptide repeat protein [Deltaproteobacteria bacterium]|nr:MAG: tetratricopeptide repeat protein [Deltaproteobacteria bacterium]
MPPSIRSTRSPRSKSSTSARRADARGPAVGDNAGLLAAATKRARGTGLLVAILTALSVAAFFPCLSGQFISDDINAIVHNEHVQVDVDPIAIFSTFSWWGRARGDAPGYRPLTTLTFALNRAAAGSYTTPYHLANIAVHVLVCLLVWALALSLGLERRAAAVAAILFCLLPIHTEAVCWIVGRAELLSAAGACAALAAALRYLARPRHALLVVCSLALLAGLFSKENAIVVLPLPALACWILYPPGKRPARRAALVTACLIGSAALYLVARSAAGPAFRLGSGDLLDNPLSVLGPGRRLLGALSILGRYVSLVLWPHPLSVDYSYDATGIGPGFTGDLYTLVGALAAALGCYAAWKTRRSHPAVSMSLVLAAAGYSIVANFPLTIGTIMGERLVYLPTVGLCITAAAWIEAALVRRPQPAMAALLAVAAVYFATDYSRARAWQTPVTLFEAAARAYPRSARAHMELGGAYGAAGRFDEARAEFDRAVAIMPDYAAAWYNLGNLLARAGRYEQAVSAYRTALEHARSFSPAWYNLALTLQLLGRLDEARQALEQGASRAPHDFALLQKLGDVLIATGDYEEAIDAYTRALDAGAPDGVRVARGSAVEWLRGCQDALPDYLAVLARDPAHPLALPRAVNCYRRLRRPDLASDLAAKAQVANRQAGR